MWLMGSICHTAASFPLRCGSAFHFPTRNSPWLLIFTQSKCHGPHCGQKPFKIGPQQPLCLLLESLPLFQPHLLTSHSLTTGSALSPCDPHSCLFFHLECLALLLTCSGVCSVASVVSGSLRHRGP